MNYNPRAKAKLCECGRGEIMTGRQSIFNPRIKNKKVCNECYLEYLRDQIQSDYQKSE